MSTTQTQPAGTVGIVGVDRDGTITVWDDGAEELFGHPSADVVGRPVDVIIPARFRAPHWDAFHRVIASGDSKLHDQAAALPTLHADGSERLLPARFVFLLDPRGAPAGAMAIYTEPAGDEVEWRPPSPWPPP